MRRITFSTQKNPTKTRIQGEVFVDDTGQPKSVKSFIDALFKVLPQIAELYLRGNAHARKVIADWFFELNIEQLLEDEALEQAADGQCIMTTIGHTGRRLNCSECHQDVEGEVVAELVFGKRKDCPHCGANVFQIL